MIHQQAMQRDIRYAIGMAYQLLRHEHVLGRDAVADALGNLETELFRLDAKLGGPRPNDVGVDDLARRTTELEWLVEDAGQVIGAQIVTLIGSVRAIERRVLHALPSRQIASRPLAGVLPLARIIPQDVHAMRDYALGAAALAVAVFSDEPVARAAGVVIGTSLIGLSLATDQRLGAVKKIPIETHHALDLAVGAACIAAPLLLGYTRKSKKAALFHVALGVSSLGVALLTDYRAAIGIGRARGRRVA